MCPADSLRRCRVVHYAITTDLQMTSREDAEEALATAKAAGLTRARIGNVHLLGEPYAHASQPTV